MKNFNILYIFLGMLIISALVAGCKGKMDSIPLEGAALKGKELYKSKGCDICHSIDGSSKSTQYHKYYSMPHSSEFRFLNTLAL